MLFYSPERPLLGMLVSSERVPALIVILNTRSSINNRRHGECSAARQLQ